MRTRYPSRASRDDRRARWMAALSAEIDRLGGHTGKIDWDTATYLYNQGVSPEIAAEKMVRLRG